MPASPEAVEPSPPLEATSTVAEESASTPTRSIEPSHTPTVTSSPTSVPDLPTPTPDTGLSDAGPWLLGSMNGTLVALNADGSGRTELDLPPMWQETMDLETGISAESGWIAFRIGGTDRPPTQLLLRMLRLPLHFPSYTIPLMNRALSDQIWEMDWEAWTSTDVTMALDMDGFWPTLLWSPDGRYLAFVSAMDGPSADIYIYDWVTEEITRATDGSRQPVLTDRLRP